MEKAIKLLIVGALTGLVLVSMPKTPEKPLFNNQVPAQQTIVDKTVSERVPEKPAEKVEEQPVVVETPQPEAKPPEPASLTGDKYDWMRAANIPESEWAAVDYIVSHESTWRPCSYNPGKSDCSLTAEQVNATCASYYAGECAVACGLGQSLPCGKWGSDWTNPVTQLVGANKYANDRYGGWWSAYSFWLANNWW